MPRKYVLNTTITRALASGLLLSLTLVLGGCLDGGSSGSTAGSTPPPPPPDVNTPPTLSGQPASSVLAGRSFSFTPNATDADGNSLTFSISGKPSWASFDASSGRISGTPTDADVGGYDVTIRVSDGSQNASLSFSLQVLAAAQGRATLSWQAPTERTDGSVLTDLAGYRIYYGSAQNDLSYRIDVSNPSVTTWVVENLTSGKWYFVTTSVDSKGIESPRSSMASKAIA